MPPTLTLRIPEALALEVGQTLTFRYRREGFVEQGFVLRLADEFVAFANSCPHWNVDLDLGDERFYDAETDRIYCKNHGAMFLPRNGRCEYGPCKGQSLERFAVSTGADALTLEIPDATPA